MTEYESELDFEGQPDLEGPLPSKAMTGDPQEGMPPPGDRPVAVDERGTTAAGQQRRDTLAERVAREEPEARPGDGARAPAGEMTAPGSDDVAGVDAEKDAVAEAAGLSPGTGPEERAMRVERG